MHILLFIIVCGLWGSNFILMKKSVWPDGVFGPMTVGAIRLILGSAVLGLIWIWRVRREKLKWPLGTRAMLGLVGLSVMSNAIPYVMQPYLIGKHSDSAFFGMMVTWVPLLTIVASVPILRIFPKWRQIIGVLLGLACMFLLFDAGLAKGIGWGDLLLAASVPTSYAVNNTFLKRYYADVSPLAVTLVLLVISGVLLLPLGLYFEPIRSENLQQLATAISAASWMGTLGTGLSLYLFYYLVTKRGPLWAGMVGYVIPIVALMWGWIDGEPVRGEQLLALLGIFIALALVQYRSRSERHDLRTKQIEVAPEELDLVDA